jgi:hypothetical protein
LQQPLDPLAGFGRLVTGGLGQIGKIWRKLVVLVISLDRE